MGDKISDYATLSRQFPIAELYTPQALYKDDMGARLSTHEELIKVAKWASVTAMYLAVDCRCYIEAHFV